MRLVRCRARAVAGAIAPNSGQIAARKYYQADDRCITQLQSFNQARFRATRRAASPSDDTRFERLLHRLATGVLVPKRLASSVPFLFADDALDGCEPDARFDRRRTLGCLDVDHGELLDGTRLYMGSPGAHR